MAHRFTRRAALRTLGGTGLVVAAGAVGLARCDRVPDSAVAAWDGPDPALTDPRERALSWALLAPNPHNYQSWIADLRVPGEIALFVDETRLLPETDPFGRQLVIGQGTFLEILVMALAEAGIGADVAIAPEGAAEGLAGIGARPIARVRLRPNAAPARDPLFAQVPHRRSNKEPYAMDRTLPPGEAAALADAMGDPAMAADFALDGPRAADLRALTRDAMVLEMRTPRTLKESVDLTRVGAGAVARHRDGIDLTGPLFWWLKRLDLTTPEKAMTPGTLAHQGGIDYALGWAEATPSFGWIASPGNSRAAQVAAGRAYLRLTLEAAARGIAIHPVSQLLQEYPEMDPLRARFLDLAGPGPGRQVQMLFRLGYAPPTPPSPRRPLAAIVRA